MNKEKYITKSMNKTNYIKVESTPIYIYRYTKSRELLEYTTEAILGKIDNRYFIAHSISRKEMIEYYEYCNINKAFDSTADRVASHPQEFITKIHTCNLNKCIDGSEKLLTTFKTTYNYAIPLFEGSIHLDTVWYKDKDHSLESFIETMIQKREENIKHYRTLIEGNVENYNALMRILNNYRGG